MNCPSDGTLLRLAERHSIEIDYCPTCRGVWLDRGEVDKIIARAEDGRSQRSPTPREVQRAGWADDDDYDNERAIGGGRKRSAAASSVTSSSSETEPWPSHPPPWSPWPSPSAASSCR